MANILFAVKQAHRHAPQGIFSYDGYPGSENPLEPNAFLDAKDTNCYSPRRSGIQRWRTTSLEKTGKISVLAMANTGQRFVIESGKTTPEGVATTMSAAQDPDLAEKFGVCLPNYKVRK